MNIFETIGSVTRVIEPFHSQFLADALEESLNGDRSLFDGVWSLAAPKGWEPPDCAQISTEETTGGGRRIDILIRSDHPVKRILGIEIKTQDDSVELGQLEKYLSGLKETYQEYCVKVSYLTPFNKCRAGGLACRVLAVKVFDSFRKEQSEDARHLSWLDVADIDWDGNALWKQHQAYVRNHISSCNLLRESSVERDRELDEFFGGEAVERVLHRLDDLRFQHNKNVQLWLIAQN